MTKINVEWEENIIKNERMKKLKMLEWKKGKIVTMTRN
jgi:hypothetical protein